MRPGATGYSTFGRSHCKRSRAQPREEVSPKTFSSKLDPAAPRPTPYPATEVTAVTKNHVGSTKHGWPGWTTSHRKGAHRHVPAHDETGVPSLPGNYIRPKGKSASALWQLLWAIPKRRLLSLPLIFLFLWPTAPPCTIPRENQARPGRSLALRKPQDGL